MDNLADGVLVVDGRDVIVDANPSLEGIFGRRLSQLAGRPIAAALESWDELASAVRSRRRAELEITSESGESVRSFSVLLSPFSRRKGRYGGQIICFRDVTRRKGAERDRERLIRDLRKALAEVKTLRGLLPICSSCRRIRDEEGNWKSVETYIRDNFEADFSHSICPDCARRLYAQYLEDPEDGAEDAMTDGETERTERPERNERSTG